MDLKQSEKRDWVAEHTLSEQDLRKLILEKMERAKQLQSVEQNRKLKEFA
jgi:hypothetical protein